jgi:diguanylate cyclase (GGDEF)-like protein/PAS domain S-box-containing protein
MDEGNSSTPAHREIEGLKTALAHVSEALIMVDLEDRITYMNTAAEELTGAAFRRAAGQPLKDILVLRHSGDDGGPLPIAVELLEEAEDRERAPSNAVLTGDKGRRVTVEFRAARIYGADGACSGAVVALRDITRRRAAELALQSSEETLLANAQALFEEKERAQVTLNSIGDAVISTDFRGRVSFLNIVAERMTGRTQAEAAGLKIDEVFLLIDSNTREQIRCPTMTAIIENLRVDLDAACSLIQKNGGEIAIEGSAAPIHDKAGGVSGAVMVARDVTIARELSNRLARLALHDNLTDLPNRALFNDRLDQALARADRAGNSVAVLFVDLDRFKPVNDSLGHAVGDQLLQAVAHRLHGCVRSSDTVCRYGGDEFLILLANVAHEQDAILCADKVKAAFDSPYEITGQTLRLTASIGIATFPKDAHDAATLLKCADSAMYEAKCNGRNSYRWFDPSTQSDDLKAPGAVKNQ